MKQFFKYVLATFVGLMVFSFVWTFLVIGIGAGIAAAGSGKTEIESNSVLRLSFDEPIQEIGQDNPFAKFTPGGGESSVLALHDVKKALRAAAKDDKIKGILLDPRMMRCGISTSDAIRKELIEFKKSGKFIRAYGDVMTEGAYYLCSVADKIVLSPEGEIEMNGLATNSPFFKGLFEKLEVQPEVFKVGMYKSAVEPFLLDKMSDANREQTTSFLGSIYDYMLSNVAASRKLPIATLKATVDSTVFIGGQDALNAKLVDQIAYFDQMEADIRKATDTKEDKKVRYISLNKYIGTIDDKDEEKETSDDAITIISAEGSIATGDNDDGIGSDRLTELLRKARRDEDTKAVVLRVNSPGGDALASDVIWREVVLLKEKKPVIVSMGDVAASGGYYIAMAASKVYAQPTTITGSIGVFGIFFNSQKFWNNKTGITFDGVKTNPYGDFPNFTRPFTGGERRFLQKYVDKTYESFTAKAAQGRNMPQDRIKELGQGRVWTGLQARENHLVDEIGGLDDAVKEAAKMAKLEEGKYEVKTLPRDKDFFEEIMKDLMGQDDDSDKAAMLVKILGEEYGKMAAKMLEVQKLQGIQARLPFEIDFK